MGPTQINQTVSALPTASGSPFVDVSTIAGVDKTGVADSQPALQAAITATPGAIYYFPPGSYLISVGALTLGANTKLYGAGPNLSVLKNTSYATFAGPIVDTSTAAGVEIKDLGFTYTGSVGAVAAGSSTALALKIRSASKFRLENCRVICTNRVSAGVGVNSWFAPRSGAAAVSDYVIKNNTISVKDICLDVNSIVTDGYIQDNNFLYSGVGNNNYAVYLALCNNITFDGNSAQGAVVLAGSQYVGVLNNNVVTSQAPVAAPTGAIALSAEAGGSASKFNIVIGNVVKTTYGSYTAAICVDANCHTNIVADNYIEGSTSPPSAIDVNAIYCTIQGNRISGCSVGITANASSNNCSILGNVISDTNTRGIVCNAASGVFISNNVLQNTNGSGSATNTGAAIYVNTTTHLSILSNHIKFSSAPAEPAYGIYCNSACTAASCLVANNNTKDAVTAAYSLNGATSANNL